ncbi:unnamed protein product [Paramecium primaurelia]|uniref:FCP1 homology domain-containing protein n=1 Tax=Paramecium primaurelia TaxID=5886 RepID=A0A8S1PSS4_PARPR|nr:unnamed protein product [Paramecium primaurelia]
MTLFKNCYEHFRGKFSKQYISAQTPKMHQKKKVLVLDLDETLVHCEFKENPNFQHEAILKVIHKEQEYKVYLRTRPHLNKFLLEASQDYEIIIFTAGYEVYCEKVLEYIDKDRLISDYYARGSCQFINGVCFKDLFLLDRLMEDIIFIDNNPNAFDRCQENGLLIPSYLDSDDDDCLLKLIPFLKFLSKKKDLRPIMQHLHSYENNIGATLFTDNQKTLEIQKEAIDDDSLSEDNVVKKDIDITDLDIKHKKTQTHFETVSKVGNKIRSATLFSG